MLHPQLYFTNASYDEIKSFFINEIVVLAIQLLFPVVLKNNEHLKSITELGDLPSVTQYYI
jgi:hypothetical protein